MNITEFYNKVKEYEKIRQKFHNIPYQDHYTIPYIDVIYQGAFFTYYLTDFTLNSSNIYLNAELQIYAYKLNIEEYIDNLDVFFNNLTPQQKELEVIVKIVVNADYYILYEIMDIWNLVESKNLSDEALRDIKWFLRIWLTNPKDDYGKEIEI